MNLMNFKIGLGGLFAIGGVVALFAAPTPAAAHICMDFPVSRIGPDCVIRSPQKTGPCPVPRGDHVSVFSPGETIRVIIRETVDHPSHYRIAFNPNGEDFRDPIAVDDIDNDYPYILLDGIEDADEAIQEVEITFPDEPTENGVLQLIQVMYDKGGNGFGGNSGEPGGNDDLYYACADIALRPGGASASAADVAAEEAGGTRAASIALPTVLLLAGAGFVRRNLTRRRDTI